MTETDLPTRVVLELPGGNGVLLRDRAAPPIAPARPARPRPGLPEGIATMCV